MRVGQLGALVYAAVCAAAAAPATQELHVAIPMRDGTRLYANVFRPSQAGRFPTILYRTPYGKGKAITPNFQAFVDHGYAVVVQDVRGRYESEGVFRLLDQEPQDGDDTLNWIARQPWSDGKIGMTGGSYLGIVQWKTALLNNPHLKAIFPWVSGDDDYFDRFYSSGGAIKLGQRLLWMSENLRLPGFRPNFLKFIWHLPLRTADMAALGRSSGMYQAALRHPSYDGFWRKISTREQIGKIKVPVFSVGGWYDNFVESDLDAVSALRKTSGVHRILVGPWPHDMRIKFPGVDFGANSVVPLRGLQFEWFDQWLKGKDTPVLSRAPVRIYVMGADRWREDHEWPPPHMRPTPYYLESKGHANSLRGDGVLGFRPTRREAEDRFTYNPRDPVPTRGGAVCCNPKVFPWGPMDQRAVESRYDVLVYTSKALQHDLEVTGPVRLVLWTSTSVRDTDFTAKLVDVFPNGEARNLADGILRLRYRESLEKPVLANPGQIYRITVNVGVTSNLFRKGHRIRLEVSSSNFPRFDRNPNTGGPLADEVRLAKATQTIYHDSEHPSYLLLPVIP